MSLVKNIDFLRHLPKLPKLPDIAGLQRSGWGLKAPAGTSRLIETSSFGANPGDLRMLSFVPAAIAHSSVTKPPLVVVLHGCTQNAAGYDVGAGWSMLAERYGFALLMPEQKASNNGNGCFNWFNPDDITRGSGEACSIRQMIEQMAVDHDIDRERVFVTGLSAGGAMTSVMLATYPDIFAGGAVIAGLPYGLAANVREALDGMHHSSSRSGSELGDLVRNATRYNGPWPKLSVWHGSADRTVNPSNASEIVKQWLDVHGLPTTPMAQTMVDGYPHQVWWNADGVPIVESYTITGMAHGTPLGVSETDEQFGAEGAFLIEAGISSSYLIAKFFGLTGQVFETAKAVAIAAVPGTAPAYPAEGGTRRGAARRPTRSSSAIDVGAVITRALTAAGLMK